MIPDRCRLFQCFRLCVGAGRGWREYNFLGKELRFQLFRLFSLLTMTICLARVCEGKIIIKQKIILNLDSKFLGKILP